MDCSTTTCKCPCHKMPGLLITLIGLVFALSAFGVMDQDLANKTWPILLILLGLKKCCSKGMCKCCPDA